MTRYQKLRRADTKGQHDRRTWAGLDKVKFNSDVCGTGEYLIDDPPVFFGQAFDLPPFFTYSAINKEGSIAPRRLTVGIAEWLQDEGGLYIGAKVFITVKDFDPPPQCNT